MAEQRAYLISCTHFQDRETRGVQKEECIVAYVKVSDALAVQPQLVVLYPKSGRATRDVLKCRFLDEVLLEIEPDPRNVQRNIIVNLLPLAVSV